MSNVNTPASEEPIDTSILAALSHARHYGFAWKGSEPEGANLQSAGGQHLVGCPCLCDRTPCGLIAVIEPECLLHRGKQVGAAKQVHWARDCPSAQPGAPVSGSEPLTHPEVPVSPSGAPEGSPANAQEDA